MNSLTAPSNSIMENPGAFFTPLSFINFLTLATSSHLPALAYKLANSTYRPLLLGSSFITCSPISSPNLRFPWILQAPRRAPNTPASGLMGISSIRSLAASSMPALPSKSTMHPKCSPLGSIP
ncbi:hypothetical protein PanWU01x14_120210 [Parasponia andersonii]|uniref:Uncharacterized protein n=1 Tax=Parasponia andersonii TaxID=3476 RepID=A0A2P5CUU8_PARAD|nr:hypothetical protein PanWU01x14_120210 [Parasponia andersonii]